MVKKRKELMGNLRLVVKDEFISLGKVREPYAQRIKVGKKTLIKIVLFAFVFAVFVPLQFSIFGQVVSLHQLILIAAFVPCISLFCITLYKKTQDLVITDITIALYSLWVSMSIVYVHGLDDQVITIAFHLVNTLGCYLFGRMLVRDKELFVFLMRALVFLVILSIPFAVYENLHSIRTINSFFANYGLMIDGRKSQNIRLGYHRAMLTFDNTILYGVVCSIVTGAAIYIVSTNWEKRILATIAIGVSVCTSISSAAILSYLIQIVLSIIRPAVQKTAERVGHLKISLMIMVLCLFVYYFVGINLEKAVTSISISDQTAVYRLYIYKYGFMEVVNSPLFGIGFNDWVRPSAMTDSIDSFWLFNAMRHGVPAFLLIGITFVIPIFLFFKRMNGGHEKLVSVYTLGLIGATVALGTVHVWGTAHAFVILFLSSGIFLFTLNDSSVEEIPDRHSGWASGREHKAGKRSRKKRVSGRRKYKYK